VRHISHRTDGDASDANDDHSDDDDDASDDNVSTLVSQHIHMSQYLYMNCIESLCL
jgi:hypothetical protein